MTGVALVMIVAVWWLGDKSNKRLWRAIEKHELECAVRWEKHDEKVENIQNDCSHMRGLMDGAQTYGKAK